MANTEIKTLSDTVSPFQRTVNSAKFIKNQLRQNMKASLLTEAKALAPDINAIAEKLDSFDMFSGDKRLVQNKITPALGAYEQGFSENPFYAFSKEGRQQINVITNTINNANNDELIQNKIQADDVLKKASTDNIINKLQIRGKQIKVKDSRGVSNWINIDQYYADQDSYEPLTVIADYNNTATVGSVYNTPFSTNMADPDKIEDKINDILDNVGKTKDTRFETGADLLETINESSNRSQLAAAYDYLRDGGLTDAEMNTLISEELSRNINQTYEQARTNAIGNIGNRANTKIEDERTRSRKKNPLGGSGSEGGGGITGTSNATDTDHVILGDNASASFVFKGTTGSLNDVSGIEGSLYNTKAVDYGGVLDNGTTITVEDTNIPSRRIVDIPAIDEVVRLGLQTGNIKMLNNKGVLENVNADMFKNSSVYNSLETSPKKVMHLEDNNGKMAPIAIMQLLDEYLAAQRANPNANIPVPTKLNPYFSNVEGTKTKQANYVPYLTFTALVQTTDNDIVGDKTKKQLNSDNTIIVDGTNSALTDEVYNYQIKYNGLDPTNTIIDDDVALPTIFVKIGDTDLFRKQMGGNIAVPKRELEAQAASTRQQQIYVPSSNFSTNSDIPSQINGVTLPTLSGTK